MDNWYKGKITKGLGIGKTLGYPTLNLHDPAILKDQKEGVYASLIKIENKIYAGILYYGPRLILNERKNILEIYLFDFDKQVYGQTIEFMVKDFIRGVRKFSDFTEFKKQLALDCQIAREILK